MTNEQLKKEFGRWVDNGKGMVWYSHGNDWKFIQPSWEYDGHYITNDKHAELRKLQIDKPDTEFEYKSSNMNKWLPIGKSSVGTRLDTEYRVKVEPVYEWIFYSVKSDKTVTLSKHLKSASTGWTKIEKTKRRVK